MVDLERAKELDLPVFRVPAYSPPSVAEYAVALLFAINRKIHLANNRTKRFNFSIDGLMGRALKGQIAGVVGTGRIGKATIEILKGIGMNIIAYDKYPSKINGVSYVTLDELLSKSDVITLHLPLTPETKYLINSDTISKMKDGVILINTARGELIETRALINALEANKVRGAGLDVYEHEKEYFFRDKSHIQDECSLLSKLLSFEQVILTGHQAFFTKEALEAIAQITLKNLGNYIERGELTNEVNLFLSSISSC